jgi:hypothetical protein
MTVETPITADAGGPMPVWHLTKPRPNIELLCPTCCMRVPDRERGEPIPSSDLIAARQVRWLDNREHEPVVARTIRCDGGGREAR